MNRSKEIRPIPFWQTLILFGIPGVIVYFNIYVGVPYLVDLGVPLVLSFPPLLMMPVLLPASIVLYKREGNDLSWARFKERFRLEPIQGKQWLWIVGTFLLAQLSDVVFGFAGLDELGRCLADVPLFKPPLYLPSFMDPRVELVLPLTEFLRVRLAGNWWILVWWLSLMFLSNLGEEFMWRGYILPRQELSHGKSAWLVNGLLWNFVLHAVLKWQYIGMMPSMLLTPWICSEI